MKERLIKKGFHNRFADCVEACDPKVRLNNMKCFQGPCIALDPYMNISGSWIPLIMDASAYISRTHWNTLLTRFGDQKVE